MLDREGLLGRDDLVANREWLVSDWLVLKLNDCGFYLKNRTACIRGKSTNREMSD